MAERAVKTNLLGMSRRHLEHFCVALGEKPFRARQVLQWIHQRGVTDFALMTDLSKRQRDLLQAVAEIRPPEVIREQRSADGTIKWAVATGNGAVETVFIPEPGRGTLCISSQVGCMLNCTFCSTATQGFARNLSAAEIIGQVWLAVRRIGPGQRITNVVLMGMGEPLLNLDQVRPALELMRDDLAYGLAARRVTVSTAGVVPGIDALRDAPPIALAVSLHAPNDELRNRLVPLNRKYPLAELLASCKRYLAERKRPKQSITFEYTMIDGVNDAPELAFELRRVLAHVRSKINLIPFNPFPGTPFRCSSPEAIARFQKILRDGGLIATVRKTRGDDIDAACGQLVGKVLSAGQRRAIIQQQLARRALA